MGEEKNVVTDVEEIAAHASVTEVHAVASDAAHLVSAAEQAKVTVLTTRRPTPRWADW